MSNSTNPSKHEVIPAATAKISHVFNLIGRGLVIVLDKDFDGCIEGPIGVIRNKLGSSSFTGPEFVDGRSGSALAVVATAPNAKVVFSPGDTIEFFSAD